MNQSGKSYGVTVFRGLCAVLCPAMLLFVMEAPAETQSLPTRHVRAAVISGQAQFLNRLPATQPLRIDIVLPLRDQARVGCIPARGLRSLKPLLQALPYGARVHRALRS
jgi:hypothetical protein